MLRGRKSTREPDLDDTSGGIVEDILITIRFFGRPKKFFIF